MDRTRKLRRELTFEVAKLNGLQLSAELAVDDASTEAMATQIRTQAGICLKLLDEYQSSVPGRMWTYTEVRCQPLREDLRRTEKLFRDASGEFRRRRQGPTDRRHTRAWMSDEFGGPEAVVATAARPTEAARPEPSPASAGARSRNYIEAHNRQDLEGLLALVDDDVSFKLAFDPPVLGKAAVRRHYEEDWAGHEAVRIDIRHVFEAGQKVAIEVHVDSGPPSHFLYDGVIVQHWKPDGLLARSQLYVDEVVPSADAAAPPLRSRS